MTKLELYQVVGTAALVIPIMLGLVVWLSRPKRERVSHHWGYAMAVNGSAHNNETVCPHCKSKNVTKTRVLEASLNGGAQKLAGVRIRCRVCEEDSYFPDTSNPN